MIVFAWILGCILALTDGAKVNPITLVPGKDPYILLSPGHPNLSPTESDVQWVFETQSPARISIHCTDFRFVQTDPCRVSYLVINAGQADEETLCGSKNDYTKISKSSKMTLDYYTGNWGGGAMKCLVQATTSDNVYHFHGADPTGLDSGEAGLINHPGKRSTSCKCGWVNKNPSRIFGGRETLPHEYPWLVAMVRGSRRRMPFCGGSIITQYHVLSAAHCFTTKKGEMINDEFSVLVGEHDWQDENNKEVQIIKVKDVIIYQNYTYYYKDFDIALLNLERKIEFNDKVGPICLPKTQLDLRDEWIKVMGWGQVNREGYFSTIPKVTSVKVVDYNVCNARYHYLLNAQNQFYVCAWAKETNSCKGDSGGPLVWLDPETNRYTQSALTSFSIKSCAEDEPNVNTDVSYFYDWIQLEIQNSNPQGETCSKV